MGCGAQVGSVTGKVSFQGKPIPVGTVAFFGQQNRVVVSDLAEDGTYQVDQLPIGGADITVETPNVEPYSPTSGEPPPPPGVLSPAFTRPNIKIPPRYTDRQQSGLRLEIQPGQQTYDILLEK